MNSSITEELFFTGLIGNVSIDSIIPYILKMETAEYNSQDSDLTEWQPITPTPRTVRLKISESPLQVLTYSLNSKPLIIEPCFLTMHGTKSLRNLWQIKIICRWRAQDDTWNVFLRWSGGVLNSFALNWMKKESSAVAAVLISFMSL